MAEPWSDGGGIIDDAALISHAKPFSLEAIPREVLLITAGVDVQDDRLEITLLGWNKGGEIFALDHRVLWGSPDSQHLWQELEGVLLEKWKHPLGGQIEINAMIIDEPRWRKGFAAAFTALGAMGRLEQPASYFLDHATSWLRSHGVCVDIGDAFTAASLGWGDVCWTDFRVDGQVLELGLNPWGIGRKASATAWQRVLRTGELLAPSPPLLKLAPRSPARVIVG